MNPKTRAEQLLLLYFIDIGVWFCSADSLGISWLLNGFSTIIAVLLYCCTSVGWIRLADSLRWCAWKIRYNTVMLYGSLWLEDSLGCCAWRIRQRLVYNILKCDDRLVGSLAFSIFSNHMGFFVVRGGVVDITIYEVQQHGNLHGEATERYSNGIWSGNSDRCC